MTLSVLIQIFMWIAVASQFFLVVPDVMRVFKTRNTVDIKKSYFIVWLLCSLGWILYAILVFVSGDLPIEEIIGMIISETFNVLCIVYILTMKLINVKAAKYLHLKEKEWYEQYKKNKELKSKLRAKYGTSDFNEIKEIKEDRKDFVKKIKRLSRYKKYEDIFAKRISKSTIYRDRVKGDFTKLETRVQKFIDVCTTSELAAFYALIVKDMSIRQLKIDILPTDNIKHANS